MAAPKTKIFVGHLPDGCKNEDLQTLFSKYGMVKECDVINKYGFVHMSTPEEAEVAIKNLNNFNWKGSCISVEPSKSRLHPEPGAPGRAKTNFSRNGGGPTRNGFGPRSSNITVSGYGNSDSFSNGYRSGPPAYPSPDPYYDRPMAYTRERARPYPSPYERSSPVLPVVRQEYVTRPLPPPLPPGTSEPYGRPIPTLGQTRAEMYERRSMVDRGNYLYSRRSPPTMPTSRPFMYGDSYTNANSGRTLATPARRPAYY